MAVGRREFPEVFVRAFLREIQRGAFPDARNLCERLRLKPAVMAAVMNGVAATANGLAMCANKHGDTPLLTAARSGQLELLRSLLADHGVSPEHTNSDGKTALHEAAQNSHVDCVRELIRHGASVDCLKKADW